MTRFPREILAFVLLISGSTVALAQDAPARDGDSPPGPEKLLDALSVEEISRRLENPLTDLWSLTFQENLTLVEGDAIEDTEIQSTFFFQPLLPVPVGRNRDKVFIARPVFPLVTNPVLDPREPDGVDGSKTGFGDVQMLTLFGPNRKDGVVWGLGGTFKFPTASDDALGQDKWQAGPGGMYFWLGRPWVVGVLAQHWWSYAGDDDRDSVSQTDIQYVARRSLPGGWSIGMGPTVTIDWKADGNDKLTFPIGLGITKTFRWNGIPWKVRFEPQYSILRPDDFWAACNFRFQIAPVIPSPFR
jgi:hypothetical protein